MALVGFGAIGQALAAQLRDDPKVHLAQVIVQPQESASALALCRTLAPATRVLSAIDFSAGHQPDLVVECAGHGAVQQHVVPALSAGVPCVLGSIGALHDASLLARLEAAAQAGGTQIRLVAGAIGAIDALAAGSLGGLEEVTYIGRKPPLAWSGTPAEKMCDLASLTEPVVIFRGTARQAAQDYPKNANVAATVSLAGLGLDRTKVELVADPGVTRNVHRIEAHGAFGRLQLQLENLALPANPKTSALTVYSLARAVRNAASTLVF